MAKVFIEESSLTAIGDVVRKKTGSVEPMSPAEMVTAIDSIGSGMDIPPEGLFLTGSCLYAFTSDRFNWYLNLEGVTTNDITDARGMFYQVGPIDTIHFDINLRKGTDCTQMFWYTNVRDKTCPTINGAIGNAERMFGNSNFTTIPDLTFDNSYSYGIDCSSMFYECAATTIGTLTNLKPSSISNMFEGVNIRQLPQFVNLDLSKIVSCVGLLYNCSSLRTISEEFFQLFSTVRIATNSFFGCYALDEIRGFDQHSLTLTGTFNKSMFSRCYRLKNLIFATQEDGTPYVSNWKGQTIDLTDDEVGYAPAKSTHSFSGFSSSSGITADKEVIDAASYEALKNDPDWWTRDPAYSRYNHDSAVNTINSLPDTNAALSGTTYTNTIKFLGAAGELTDGGAINTLTEEEIAVAAAKGWTVTLT